MQLKNHVEWALHCCSVLAGLEEGQRLPAKVLAEFHGIPKEYLSKALQNLSAAGIVTGTLGPAGGYRLARDPKRITFLDIVEAVEGAGRTFVCTEIRDNAPCAAAPRERRRPCAIARVMWEADEAWRSKLRSVSLDDLMQTLSRDVPAKVWNGNARWLSDQRAGG
ncbi:MAG: RrF2 family transcriptional regulator [Phycisphaerales bacterium JB061]